MSKLRTIYGIGCWVFGIFIGIGHTAFELAPRDERRESLVEMLQQFSITMPGTQSNAYLLTFGISLTMGLMFFAYGVINLLILSDTPKRRLPNLSYQVTNLTVSLAAFLLAWTYLFTVPIALTAIASICFLISLVGGQMSSREKSTQI